MILRIYQKSSSSIPGCAVDPLLLEIPSRSVFSKPVAFHLLEWWRNCFQPSCIVGHHSLPVGVGEGRKRAGCQLKRQGRVSKEESLPSSACYRRREFSSCKQCLPRVGREGKRASSGCHRGREGEIGDGYGRDQWHSAEQRRGCAGLSCLLS